MYTICTPGDCHAVHARRPTSWRGRAGIMEIVALTGSTSDISGLPRPSLFTIFDDNVKVETFIHVSNNYVE